MNCENSARLREKLAMLYLYLLSTEGTLVRDSTRLSIRSPVSTSEGPHIGRWSRSNCKYKQAEAEVEGSSRESLTSRCPSKKGWGVFYYANLLKIVTKS